MGLFKLSVRAKMPGKRFEISIRGLAVVLLLVPVGFSQANPKSVQDLEPGKSKEMQSSNTVQEIKGTVKVTVDVDKPRGMMAPRALAVEASVGDNNMVTVEVLTLLKDAGVTTLRYPGTGYADNYHWATFKPTSSQAPISQRYSAFAANNDFGHFAALFDRLGTAVITVNYGSNQDGSGGGEPAEAAAWVAFANGDPKDAKVIGKDSTGFDWQTVGYWASLRASQPLSADDGKNFLRIAHPQPLNVLYWEVGDSVYQNGYYPGDALTVDLHAPYTNDPKSRQKNPNLSPEAYGKAFLLFSKAMKAVDARIKVGASLGSPIESKGNVVDWVLDPVSGKYVNDPQIQGKTFDAERQWDTGVLKIVGHDVDFAAIHWYAGTGLPPGWKDLDNANLLMATRDELPNIMVGLSDLFKRYCGQNAQNMQMLITGLGLKPFLNVKEEIASGLFTTDAYLNLMLSGAANIDWTELRKGGFLDEKNKPGPAYFGIQMVHFLMNLREPLVTATTSNPLLAAYAAKHPDGSLTVMLINKDPKNVATVKVTINGDKLATTGMRFDFGKSNPPADNLIAGNQIEEVGNSFTLTVPAYTVSDVLIPKAK